LKVLHAGSGGSKVPQDIFGAYEEVSLDIDPRCSPDMIGSMVDMDFVPDGTFDAVYTSHTLEHLYPHDVRRCVHNFQRVLKPGGVLMVVVPDLEWVQPTEEIVYMSESGPICGLDMYYGKHDMIENNEFMAHHSGFVRDTLRSVIETCNLKVAQIFGDKCYNLYAIAYKEPIDVLQVD
jgi:predicted SAM-dependent methyltransferase